MPSGKPGRIAFLDVDTQADFMLPAGKLYVPGAEILLPTITRLREFAERHGIPIVASADAHATDDPEFRQWPPHCIRGTPGQLKLPATLEAQYLVVPRERQAPLTEEELSRYPQFVLEKNTLDLFTNPQAEDLLRRVGAQRYLVYGVATEFCVHLAVKGLLRRKQHVAIIRDAIGGINADAGHKILAELKAGGAELITSEQVIGDSAQ